MTIQYFQTGIAGKIQYHLNIVNIEIRDTEFETQIQH